jgi:hypothetical protein
MGIYLGELTLSECVSDWWQYGADDPTVDLPVCLNTWAGRRGITDWLYALHLPTIPGMIDGAAFVLVLAFYVAVTVSAALYVKANIERRRG